MSEIQLFLEKYYLIFLITAIISLLALIGYFIDKKNSQIEKDKFNVEEINNSLTTNSNQNLSQKFNNDENKIETLDEKIETLEPNKDEKLY